jgi:hypothetical protein
LALVLAAAAPARAFDDPAQFLAPPGIAHAASISASAEGLYFTGAPRFARQTCASCHVGAPGLAEIKLGADPASLFTDGYQPGQTYLLEVELLYESRGFEWNASPFCTEPPALGDHYAYVQCNNNAFVLEADVGGAPLSNSFCGQGGPCAPTFCAGQPNGDGSCPTPAPDDESLVAPDGDAVFANRAHDPAMPKVVVRNDPTRWHLWWRAPLDDRPVTFYLGLVDGNGGTGTPDNDQDPYGDDTASAAIDVPRAGAPPPAGASAGCAVAARLPRTAALVLGMVVALLLGRRAARRRP